MKTFWIIVLTVMMVLLKLSLYLVGTALGILVVLAAIIYIPFVFEIFMGMVILVSGAIMFVMILPELSEQYHKLKRKWK